MKKFEIWVEGYSVTGQQENARLLGIEQGESFEEAITNYIIKNPNCGINIDSQGRFNIWGCKLFNNEQDARKIFG